MSDYFVGYDLSKHDFILGTVVGSDVLEMYEKPNKKSDVITEINKKSKVLIDLKNSTDEFYRIYNAAGIEGYCKKESIRICS